MDTGKHGLQPGVILGVLVPINGVLAHGGSLEWKWRTRTPHGLGPVEALLVCALLLDLALTRLLCRLLALLGGLLPLSSLEFELDALPIADSAAQFTTRKPNGVVATGLHQNMGVGDLDDLAGNLALCQFRISDAKRALLSLCTRRRRGAFRT